MDSKKIKQIHNIRESVINGAIVLVVKKGFEYIYKCRRTNLLISEIEKCRYEKGNLESGWFEKIVNKNRIEMYDEIIKENTEELFKINK